MVKMEHDDWHVKLYEAEQEDYAREHLKPYSLKGTTERQEQALRTLAEQVGFKNMRGFNKWMEAADVTYYDLIKIASP